MNSDYEDDWSEQDAWEDWPEDEDEETEVISCSHCGAEVYEDAEQCPVCGQYLLRENRLWQDKPAWWVILGLAGIVAVVIVLGGLGVLL